MVIFISEGNIFRLNEVENYAHGCNCAGAMGKGIALTFKQKFPEMYEEYKLLCKDGDFNLGDVFVYEYSEGFIFNLGTQLTWKTPVDYEGLSQAIKKMLEIATSKGITSIALPKIGAGLGRGDWQVIKTIILQISEEFDWINLYIVENYKDIELSV